MAIGGAGPRNRLSTPGPLAPAPAGMPDAPSPEGPEFVAAYQCVRATVVEDWLVEMVEITDRDDLDPLDKRVRIDARQWIMSKVAPGRYGDKLIVGGDGSRGVGGAISLSDLSDEQFAALEQLASLRVTRSGRGTGEHEAAETSEG
jgi:hypothetical protein